MQVVPDMVLNAAKRFGDSMCVSEGSRSHTFAETEDRVGRLARGFLDDGVSPGDRIALLAMNELEYTEIQAACQRAGLILVPLNFRLAMPELQFMIDDCEPTALIHGPGFADHARELGVARSFHLGSDGHGDPYDGLLASASGPVEGSPLLTETPCVILYTSGTTGRPKGAVLSNLAMWSRMVLYGLDWQLEPGQVLLQCLPLFHIASNVGYAFTHRGGGNIFLKAFSPEGVFDHVANDRPSHVLLVPTMINMIVNHPDAASADFSSVDTVIYGASTIAPKTLERALEVMGCDFVQMFGMTETSGCTVLRPADHDPVNHPERLASAGTDATGFETRVVGPDDTEPGPGEVGEIVTRGPAVMTEYWRNEEATADALRNGWMHTGDAGYRGDDGYIYVTDRIKDMIISGGENVYPREIEDVLFAHEDVLEAAVIGVPDDRWGERVHAVVAKQEGSEVTDQVLLEYCRARLAGYKTPRSLEFVDALPKNITGKVLKTELRAPHWSGEERGVN
ncbi:MAG: class I adenylate-forming enzyme family protein [Acidimicrobiales bacterium]